MSEIAKKSVETLGTRVAMQLFAAAGGIAIARILSPAGKGEWTYAGTVLGFALMATVGHNKAVLWQYARRRLPAASIIRVMVLVVIAMSAPIVLGLLLVGLFIPSQSSLLFVALALPFAIFSQSSVGIFLGDGNVRPINFAGMFPTVIATLIYVPLIIFAHGKLWIPLTVWSAAYVAGGIYTSFALRRYYAGEPVEDVKGLAKEQLTFGSQACLSSLMQYLDFRIDVFLVIYMLGSAALGIYSIGIAIGEFIWQLSSAMIYPALKDIGGTDEARAAEVTAKCMRHSFLLVFLAAICVAVSVRTLVPLIYGPAFAYGAIVTIVLLPGIVAYSMMPALAAFFSQQLGQPRIPFYFSALSATLCAIVTALTLRHFGVIAAAAATSISYTAAFSAAAVYFARLTGYGGRRLFIVSAADMRPYYSLLTSCLSAVRGR